MLNTTTHDQKIRTFSISNDPDWYEAFPDVALTKSGRLVCTFAECVHHGDRSQTRIVCCHSDDCGETWSDKRAVTELKKGELFYNCARIVALRNGRLALNVDCCEPPQKGVERSTSNIIYFSEDDGMTWSDPMQTPVQGIVPDRIIERADGRWLIAAHGQSNAGRLVQRVWWTDDQGASWQGPGIVGDLEDHQLCEASIIDLGDVLVALMRENSFDGRDAFKSMSYDGGEHWTTPVRFPLPGCHRPVGGQLSDGRVLITHRYMQGGKGWVGYWTQNTFVALTDRESLLAERRSDAWARIMPLDFDRSPESDTGYTGWIQFPDGDIYVVNYIMDDAAKAQIRGYRFSPDMFYVGAPKD